MTHSDIALKEAKDLFRILALEFQAQGFAIDQAGNGLVLKLAPNTIVPRDIHLTAQLVRDFLQVSMGAIGQMPVKVNIDVNSFDQAVMHFRVRSNLQDVLNEATRGSELQNMADQGLGIFVALSAPENIDLLCERAHTVRVLKSDEKDRVEGIGFHTNILLTVLEENDGVRVTGVAEDTGIERSEWHSRLRPDMSQNLSPAFIQTRVRMVGSQVNADYKFSQREPVA